MFIRKSELNLMHKSLEQYKKENELLIEKIKILEKAIRAEITEEYDKRCDIIDLCDLIDEIRAFASAPEYKGERERMMNNWIPIKPGCKMPENGEDVLVTICELSGYGKHSYLQFHTDYGTYHSDCGYLESSNGVGGFDTCNDWDEGQPIKVIAWMKTPEPYFSDNEDDYPEFLKKKFNF